MSASRLALEDVLLMHASTIHSGWLQFFKRASELIYWCYADDSKTIRKVGTVRFTLRLMSFVAVCMLINIEESSVSRSFTFCSSRSPMAIFTATCFSLRHLR